MRRGFAPIIVVAIVFAFLISIGTTVGYYKFKSGQIQPGEDDYIFPNPDTNPTASPTPDGTAYWKTYTDKSNKFSFKYPNDWSLNTNSAERDIYGIILSKIKNNETRLALGINFFNSSLESFLSQNKNNDSLISETTIGGAKAVRVSYHTLNSEAAVIEQEDRLIHLFYHESDKNGMIPTDPKVFDQILSTFRFY